MSFRWCMAVWRNKVRMHTTFRGLPVTSCTAWQSFSQPVSTTLLTLTPSQAAERWPPIPLLLFYFFYLGRIPHQMSILSIFHCVLPGPLTLQSICSLIDWTLSCHECLRLPLGLVPLLYSLPLVIALHFIFVCLVPNSIYWLPTYSFTCFLISHFFPSDTMHSS